MTNTSPEFCIYCAADIHLYCGDDNSCCCAGKENLSLNLSPTGDDDYSVTSQKKRGPKFLTEGFKDALSAGRKRAARMYPIAEGQLCEWSFKKNCGGGIVPVMGCSGRLATNIHHGPDKSVLNNERDNISIICAFCHNLWHAKNDEHYIEPRPADGREWLPLKNEELTIHALSDMEQATLEEIILHEIKLDRQLDPGEVYSKFGAMTAKDAVQ